jgi:hypothetical protein
VFTVLINLPTITNAAATLTSSRISAIAAAAAADPG